eukprot:Em0010g372a
MELKDLLARAKALSKDKQRRVGAIIGAVIADAAAQPTHWVYDDNALKEALKDHAQPEFLPQSVNPFYRLETGNQSFYGEHLVLLLRSLVECKGVDTTHLRDASYKALGPGSSYDHPGQNKKAYPMQGKYLDGSMKAFIKLYSEGTKCEDNTKADSYTLCLVPPLAALYASHPDLLKHIETVTSLFQTNPMVSATVLAEGRLIEQYIQGAEHPVENVLRELSSPTRQHPTPADQELAGHIEASLQSKPLSIHEATQKFGKACYLPGPFQSALRALLDDQGYASAVREVLKAGGNNCIREVVVGACLGAKYGLDEIPLTWFEKTDAAKEALELSLALVELVAV